MFGFAVVGGVDTFVVPPVVLGAGLAVFDDDEQPVISAIATPAPAIAMPFSNERRLTGSSGACMATVYRARLDDARQTLGAPVTCAQLKQFSRLRQFR
jgi:hypothetical protein